MRTLLRGKPYKSTHEKGGYTDEVIRLVGKDEFGNRYYEDFNHSNKNTRRWVEYADYNKWFLVPKKVAPGWHGWLHYQFDDPPSVRIQSLMSCIRKRLKWSRHTDRIRLRCSRPIIRTRGTGTLGTFRILVARRTRKIP